MPRCGWLVQLFLFKSSPVPLHLSAQPFVRHSHTDAMLVSSGAQRAFAAPRSLRLTRNLSTSLWRSKPNPTSSRHAPAAALQSDRQGDPVFVDLDSAVDLQAKDVRRGSAEYRSHIRVSLAEAFPFSYR